MSDKTERLNDLIEEIQSEINQPIWSEDQKEGLIEAQGALDEVKKSAQRNDYKYSSTGLNHVSPEE